jgi:hypothetical protein
LCPKLLSHLKSDDASRTDARQQIRAFRLQAPNLIDVVSGQSMYLRWVLDPILQSVYGLLWAKIWGKVAKVQKDIPQVSG